MPTHVESEQKRLTLESDMAGYNLRGQWQSQSDPTRPQRVSKESSNRVSMEPSTSGVPHCWRWSKISEFMDQALDALPESLTSRRSLILTNPALQRGTTHTLVAAYQVVAPGEVAWAHRHSINALRLGIEGGEGLYTVVDGVPVSMNPYDLVLTPGGQWHEHHNETGKLGFWLDCLDVPFTLALNQSFYEELGESVQKRTSAPNPSAIDLLQPSWSPSEAVCRPYRYPWQDTLARLKGLSKEPGSPHDGIALNFLNPITGGPTLASIGCRIHWLPPGFNGKPVRRSSSTILFVIEGEGLTIVDDQEMGWRKHDCLVVPNWTWQRLINRSKEDPAIVFSMSDAPILEKFGFYREQTEL
jgi:gentisate 1,2-dioxygenase